MIRLDCFDAFPHLTTPRLELRRITMDDAPALFDLFSDERVMLYWGAPAYTSIDEAKDLVSRIEAAYDQKAGIEWAVVDRESGRLIGKCCFFRLYNRHCRADMGYGIAPAFWGTGRMVEALSAILAYGFESMNLHSVEAQVYPQNDRSLATLARLGFVREGYLRENYYDGKGFADTVICSLIKPGASQPSV